MNSKDFKDVLTQTLDQVLVVMDSKGKEYSTDDNKLHNFDKGATMTGQSRESVLYGMALKHHISISDIRDNIDKELPTRAMLDEKFGDAINYLILEKASIIDRINKKAQAYQGCCCLGGEKEPDCTGCPQH